MLKLPSLRMRMRNRGTEHLPWDMTEVICPLAPLTIHRRSLIIP